MSGEASLSSGHDGLAELIRIGGDISSRIEAAYTRLLSRIDNETSLIILLCTEIINQGGNRCRSNGDEYPIYGEDVS